MIRQASIDALALLGELPTLPEGEPLFVHDGPVHPFKEIYDPELEWAALAEPFTGRRARGLVALAAVAHEGLVTVLPFHQPSPAAVRACELFYGSALVWAADHARGAPPVRSRGLGLHPGNTARTASAYRGRVNPHLGHGTLHGTLDKWREYEFAESVMTGRMARTIRSADLAWWKEGESRRLVERARVAIEEARVARTGVIGADDRDLLRTLLGSWLAAVRSAFPRGAILKHRLGSGTGDASAQLDAASDPELVIARACESLVRVAPLGFASSELLTRHFITAPDVPAMFLLDNLFRPEQIIVQERLALRLTRLGSPIEFRVDFLDGEPVQSHLRHTGEYYPEESRTAADAVRALFVRAPARYRYLAGGADVAIDSEGRARVIEFNFGAESYFMNAGVFANYYAARVAGLPMPLLSLLERVFATPLATQRAFVERIGESALGHPEVDATYGVFYWLRDRWLADLRDRSPRADATTTLRALRELLGVRSTVADKDRNHLDELLLGAEDYVARAAAPQARRQRATR